MKKIISVLLCLMMALCMLASCGEDIIGEYIDQYEKPAEKENITLNLYIVCEAGATDNAKVTVRERIKTYTSDNYGTTLNVIYCVADEYVATIEAKTAEGATEQADIFLITSESMFNSLYAGGRLANITALLNSEEYGTLNAEITSSLMDASMVSVDGVNQNFCVPNNHLVGEYTYLVIDKAKAREYYYSDEVLKTYTSIEALQNAEEGDMNLWKALVDAGENPADYIQEKTGKYEDKVKFENEGAKGSICNVSAYPKATKSDVYSSAFAINANCTEEIQARAMEMIYAINVDKDLCNYLQYGILGTNYIKNEDGSVKERVKDGVNDYVMNPLYTGNILKMLYCEENGWNAEAAANLNGQNKESYFAD